MSRGKRGVRIGAGGSSMYMYMEGRVGYRSNRDAVRSLRDAEAAGSNRAVDKRESGRGLREHRHLHRRREGLRVVRDDGEWKKHIHYT